MNHHLSHRLSMLVTAALALLALPAVAQVSPGATGTREQYRACVDDEAALRAQRSTLHKNTVAHNAELKRLQGEIDAHVAKQDQVLAEGGEAIQAFNTRLETLNAQAMAINRRGDDYDREQADLSARTKTLHARCSGLSVSFRDRDAVFSDRAAARAGAASSPRRIELNQTKPD